MKRGLGKGVLGGRQVLSSGSTRPMDVSEERENADYSTISVIRGTLGFSPKKPLRADCHLK